MICIENQISYLKLLTYVVYIQSQKPGSWQTVLECSGWNIFTWLMKDFNTYQKYLHSNEHLKAQMYTKKTFIQNNGKYIHLPPCTGQTASFHLLAMLLIFLPNPEGIWKLFLGLWPSSSQGQKLHGSCSLVSLLSTKRK